MLLSLLYVIWTGVELSCEGPPNWDLLKKPARKGDGGWTAEVGGGRNHLLFGRIDKLDTEHGEKKFKNLGSSSEPMLPVQPSSSVAVSPLPLIGHPAAILCPSPAIVGRADRPSPEVVKRTGILPRTNTINHLIATTTWQTTSGVTAAPRAALQVWRRYPFDVALQARGHPEDELLSFFAGEEGNWCVLWVLLIGGGLLECDLADDVFFRLGGLCFRWGGAVFGWEAESAKAYLLMERDLEAAGRLSMGAEPPLVPEVVRPCKEDVPRLEMSSCLRCCKMLYAPLRSPLEETDSCLRTSVSTMLNVDTSLAMI
uniref:Uncharacterized protein n=1 Tax=Timema cristinae TaxID=61476 RepID=A0A7R9GVT8_TIMCR|nr:unnamed protein product [Timema cristinae]